MDIGQKIRNKETDEINEIVDIARTGSYLIGYLDIYILEKGRRVCSDALYEYWEAIS